MSLALAIVLTAALIFAVVFLVAFLMALADGCYADESVTVALGTAAIFTAVPAVTVGIIVGLCAIWSGVLR